MSEWTSLKISKPPKYIDYLFFCKGCATGTGGDTYQLVLEYDDNLVHPNHEYMLTHWMPLPKPPEENK